VGLGSHAQWDEKLDGRLAQALMSVQAVKQWRSAEEWRGGSFGSEVQDEIFYEKSARRFPSRDESRRRTGRRHHQRRRRGRRGYLKPISTLRQPLHTTTWSPKSREGRVRAVRLVRCTAGAVAGEAMVALVLADAFLQKFGGDSLAEMRRNFDNYAQQIDEF